MGEKRKIAFRKSLRIVAGMVVTGVFVIALAAASRRQEQQPVKGLRVHLNDEDERSFLQKEDIEAWLMRNNSVPVTKASLDNLDLKKMERLAETNPWIANAEFYLDNGNMLRADIVQRQPVARIFEANGSSRYMDSTLHEMPVGTGYACPAPVFTNVTFARNDSINRALKTRIAFLSAIIRSDSFWSAQIEQIEVQPDQTFVLIPLLGNQRIIFGDTADAQAKLGNLFAFYKNVSGKVGWNAYRTLDLRYKGQVVAAPSLGNAGPAPLPPAPEAPVRTDSGTAVKKDPVLHKAAPSRSDRQSPRINAGDVSKNKIKTAKQPGTADAAKSIQPKYIYSGKK